MKTHGINTFIENMLIMPGFYENASLRDSMLHVLRDSIKNCPVDAQLLQLVVDETGNLAPFERIRYRSSTNAEDIEGFNGAGLYSSHTGVPGDPDKPIDEAIKKVWASLWTFRAFEEREYFRINQKSVGMGILVHRSFPNEDANGVVVTKNLYNAFMPAITINVQVGENSIVLPENHYTPDEIIYYNQNLYPDTYEYINHTNVPGMQGKTVMTAAELKGTEKITAMPFITTTAC
ncbi:MAG: hypothetical protein HC906_00485 [Bacteroidales bacterium]|nr:hypothetical protein [Bacteroidales bacterium]